MQSSGRERSGASPRQKAAKQRHAGGGVFVALISLALCGCVSGVDPILKVSDYRDEYRERAGGDCCPVHKEVKLQESLSTVSESHMLIPRDYSVATRDFPFAKSLGAFYGGGPEVDLTLYCPECERAEEAWLDDYWEKEEAAWAARSSSDEN